MTNIEPQPKTVLTLPRRLDCRVRWLPKFFIRLKPMNTAHGPDRTLMPWWRIVPAIVHLGSPKGWWNYGVHYCGRRLWLYTKWGGLHLDAWTEIKPPNAELRREP